MASGWAKTCGHKILVLIKLDSTRGIQKEDEVYFVIDEIKIYIIMELSFMRWRFYTAQMLNLVYLNSIFIIVAYHIKFMVDYLFDRQEIKRILAYLRLIINPHDNEAFLRVVNFPARGIGPKAIENIRELATLKSGFII